MEDRQPWVLNLMIPDYEDCAKMLIGNLTQLGVNNKAVKVKASTVDKPKIALHEVTKETIMEMDIETVVDNMTAYETEVLLASDSGEGSITISTV